MRSALFRLLTRLAVHHGRAVLVIATVLTVACVAITTRLQVKTNFKDLLGHEDPISQKLDYLQDNFPVIAGVRILLEGRDPERLIEVGRDIEARLAADPERVSEVILEQPVDFFLDHGLLYMQEDDLRFIEAELKRFGPQLGALHGDPSVLGALALMDRTLSTASQPAGAVLTLQTSAGLDLDLSGDQAAAPKVRMQNQLDTAPFFRSFNADLVRAMRDTPLPGSAAEVKGALNGSTLLLDGLADVLEQGDRLTDADFERRADELFGLAADRLGVPMSRFAFSPGRDALVMDVVAKRNILGLGEARPFLAWMDAQLAEVRLLNPDVSVRPTGLPVMLKEESEAIMDNFGLVTVLGLLGILAVFIIGFERVGLPSLAAVPLIMGNAWTFGIVTAFRGEITLFALTFPVLLFGLGIDFAIHLLSAYSEQRRLGLAPAEAMQATFDVVGPGLLTGALTTSGAFLVMLTASFYGLQDMGFTAGVGVLMALLSMITVLPALVFLWDQAAGARGEVLPQVPFAFLGPLGERVGRHRYPLMAAFLVGALVFAYFTSAVSLDRNYLNMLPRGLPSAEAQARMLELYGTSNEFVVFHAPDLAEAERVRAAAAASPTVAEVLSPSQLIPTGQEQKGQAIAAIATTLGEIASAPPSPPHLYDAADVAVMRDHLAGLKVSALQMSMLAAALYGDDVRDAASELRQAINRLDTRADPASAPRLQRLDALLGARIRSDFARMQRMTENRSLTAEDLPPALLSQLRGKDGQWLVVVRAKGDVWDETFRRSFLDDLGRIGSNQAGMISAWDGGVTGLVRDLPGVFAWTCLIIGAMVLIDLRSIRHSVLAMVPLVLAILCTVGLLGMLGTDFNILSIVSLPLLVGIGIDNAVHLLHRIRHDGSLSAALTHAGKPLILTSMTTIIGFGSLMLSIHPGIYGLGFATSVGMLFSLGLSLVLLPALVAIFAEDLLKPDGSSH